MPEVLADEHAQAAEAGIEGADAVALREVARFVKHGVGGQVKFMVDMQRFAAGEVGVGDVETFTEIHVHEADYDVNVVAGSLQCREDAVVGVRQQRHFRRQVLHLVAGQRELGEYQQVDALLARLFDVVEVDAQVVPHIAQFGIHLRQTDLDAHTPPSSATCLGVS